MALEYYDGSNNDGLFNVLGKLLKIIKSLNTARGTTLPAVVDAAVDSYKLDTDAPLDVAASVSAVATALTAWQGTGNEFANRVAAAIQTYITEAVAADIGIAQKSLANALTALIADMDGNYYLDPSSVSIAITPNTSATDWSIVGSIIHGDGKNNTLILPETITITPTNDTPPKLRVTSPDAESVLSPDWPGGSGLALDLESHQTSGSLIDNSGFETIDESFPTGWVAKAGAVGTAWTVTNVEVQTVAIGGTPTGGFYWLRVTCPDGIERVTDRLAYNASASTVQTALRKLSGLEQVTVSATGTTPNFTHSVTFNGIAGNVATMSSVSALTGGSPTITHGTTTAGSTNAFAGRGVVLTGDGSTNSELIVQLPTLEVDTVYCLHWRHMISSGATGTVRWAILDGFAGSVVNDSEGAANSLSVDISTLSTSFAVGKLFVRVPASLKQPAFLSIKATTAVANTKLYCLDEVCLVKAKQLYKGGPYLAAFRGVVPPVPTETWSVVCANDRAGEVHEYLDRVLNLRGSNLVLPTSGGTNIPDSIMS